MFEPSTLQSFDAYNINEQDRVFIHKELGTVHNLSIAQVEDIKFQIKIKEHISRLISYYIKLTIEANNDGIVIIDELINKIQKKIDNDFGNSQSHKIVLEIIKF